MADTPGIKVIVDGGVAPGTAAPSSAAPNQPLFTLNKQVQAGVAPASTQASPTAYSDQQIQALQLQSRAGNQAATDILSTTNTTVDPAQITADKQQAFNSAFEQLLENDDNYVLNSLSQVRQPTYKFRFFMTPEVDPTLNAKSFADIMKAVDNLPQATIAESGVTAGFNIKEVQIEQVVGANAQEWNNPFTKITITINEPLGASLLESIVSSGMDLAVSNFQKIWYYLDLQFISYNEDGSINTSPLEDMNLPNKGRWLYQIQLTNIAFHMDEGGTTYTIDCMPFTMSTQSSLGTVPDAMMVTGSTIKEFCDNFGKQLTDKWSIRNSGEIYTFKINIMPVTGDDLKRDPSTFTLHQTEIDPQRSLSLDKGNGKNVVCNVPYNIPIADVILLLYSNSDEAIKMMLDTNSPYSLVDTTSSNGPAATDPVNAAAPIATFNNKKYRIPFVPMIETDVQVTGYDPVTNQYAKVITYNIWAYRSYTTNLHPSQYTNIFGTHGDPNIVKELADDLVSKHYLKKKYEYRFTGMNTEVIRFDLDFSLAYNALLPANVGWRSSINSVSVHEKVNEATLKDKGSMKDEPNDLAQDKKDSQLQYLQTSNTSLNSQVSQTEADLVEAKAKTPPDQGQIKTLTDHLAQLQDLLKGETAAATAIRQQNKIQQDQAIASLGVGGNVYAEDAATQQGPYKLSYLQQNVTTSLEGNGFLSKWHRGTSLVGAMMSQLNQDPALHSADGSVALSKISLEIRGDPYWLGYSTMERRAFMAQYEKPTSELPDFFGGDNTFAMVFRFPSGFDDNGSPLIRSDDIFNGIFRVTNSHSTFSGGEFKQTLEARKLELIGPVITPKPSQSSGEATPPLPVTPPVAPPTTPTSLVKNAYGNGLSNH